LSNLYISDHLETAGFKLFSLSFLLSLLYLNKCCFIF
jgi:hypothetical protein